MKMRLVSGRWAKSERALKNYEAILKVEIIPGWFAKLLGMKSYEQEYIGSGTVWRSYPEFVRQDTNIELILADFYARVRITGGDVK